jgi:hypothetical protein
VDVGDTSFSAGTADLPSLAFSPSGRLYVAYSDYGNSSKATVMKYDAPFGISELQSSEILIYPNPAKDKCEVRSAKCDIKNIQIFSLTGEKVYEEDIQAGGGDAVEVDLDFPAGIYFVQVTSERTVKVGKIVKN